MGKKKTGRTGRLGLLSVKERTLIDILEQRKKLVAEKQMISKKKTKTSKDKQRIKEITKQLNYSSKRFSKFTVELLKRLDASREDLQIILLSSSLRELRKKYSKYFRKPFVDGDYDNYPLTGFFDDLGKPQPFEYDETNPISNYSTWKVHTVGSTKARKYWLSVKEELKNTVKDTTEPTYAIIGIKGHWNRIVDSKKSNGKMVNVLEDINVRKILLESLELEQNYQTKIVNDELPEIIPKSMKNAVEIANIKLRIESFQEKLRKEKRLQSKPKKIMVQKHVQTRMANARSDIGNDLKRIDKKLAKYNFKLVAKITGTYIQ